MKIRILFSLFLIGMTMSGTSQNIFSNVITGTNPNTANPYTFEQDVVPNITVSGIGRGSGIVGTSANDRYNANSWDTSALDPTAYFEFTIAPNSGYLINFSDFVYTGQASGTGPTSFGFRSSVDGYVSNIGTATAAGSTISLSNAAYQNISSPITFRFYGWGASAAGGTFSINDFKFNGTIVAPLSLDFNNLQSPGTASINLGNNFTAYAQAFEAGVTEAAGANATISSWIGYSSTNTNPNTASWTWIPATYDQQVGTRDQYQLAFGAALPEGVYYYASRFKLSTGPFTYGGFSSSNGGTWDGTSNISGILTVNGPTTPDYVNLQTPGSGSIIIGNNFNVFAQVYEPLITTLPNHQGEGIQAWIGYNTVNNNPSSAGWTWVAADFNISGGGANNDEYVLNLGSQLVAAGTYYYASRFQLDSGAYRYGGILTDGNPGGIWNGTTNVSGILTAAAAGSQEINVRGVVASNPTITSGDTSPIGTDNTLFAAANIGTPDTKTFRIQNVGSAPLNVSGITLVGGNAGDFSLVASAPYNIPSAGTNFVDFNITFNPTALGIRTTTVTIANNDLNENPYTFLIQGSGICNSATNTLAPTSGPVGTEVTVTASANNLTGASATLNGIALVVTQVSATQIKVVVPPGVSSGNITTTNSQGCTASVPFTVISEILAGCEGGGALPADLFISQITDSGTDGLSYIEIYNGTGATINLGPYSLQFFNNGSTTQNGGNIGLNSVNLINGDTYIVATGTSSLVCTSTPGGNLEYADQTSGSGGINFKNGSNNSQGHDHIRLYKNATHVDSWGVFNNQGWATSLNLQGEGANFSRLNTAVVPSTTYSNADWNIVDWDVNCSDIDYSGVGVYDFSTANPPTVTAQPSFVPTCLSTSLTVSGAEGFVGGNGIAFQWFVNVPGSTTWTALTNSGVYSGVTTATLNISNVTSLNGYQYYAQIRENTVTCYSASNATMIIVSTPVWNGTAWAPATPTASSAVTINGNYDTALHGSFDACSVVVSGGASLFINANDYVSIQNNLTVNATGILEVSNNGSLVMISNTGTVTNNGTLQVKRTTTAYKKFDYTYWSSPVVAANITSTFAGWRLDYGFSFNTANYTDVNNDGFDDDNNSWIPIPNNTVATKGIGYAIMMPTVSVPSFPAPGTTVTFSGEVNNGIINVPVVLSANTQPSTYDFNLIGNPYPSAVDGTLLIQNNATLNTLYFWTHRTAIANATPGPNTYNYVVDDYATYNLSGGVASASGSAPPTGKIASGQGFFAEVDAAGTVQFRNEFRSKLFANNDFYRQVTSERDRIWLNFENPDGLFSQKLIGYFNEATNAVDRGYDGATLASQNSVSFYSLLDSTNYRIQGRAPFTITDEVPLGFKAVQGTFKISIPFIEGQLAALDAIYLEDKQLGITHNLKAFPYTFYTNAGVFNNRFVLKYTTESLAISDDILESELVVITNSNQISFKSTNEMANVQLFDMLGRLVYESDIESTYFTTSPLTTNGVLIAKIVFRNGKRVGRKIQL